MGCRVWPQAVGDEVCAQVHARSVPAWLRALMEEISAIGTGCSPPDSWLEGISVVATFGASEQAADALKPQWRSELPVLFSWCRWES